MSVNPSEMIIEAITGHLKSAGGVQIYTEVLPTQFLAAGDRMRHLIERFEPEAVIGLGVAAEAASIRLERVALNLDDSDVADNAGDTASGRLVVSDGPVAYWSTLPLDPMLKVLRAHRIPADISNHAGTYVCNHVFYVARHEIETLRGRAKCGFIHVPLLSEQGPNRGLPLAKMIEAIGLCLGVIQDSQEMV